MKIYVILISLIVGYFTSSCGSSAPTDCECATEMKKALLNQDYDHNTYIACLDRYEEEVINGYEDLPCSENMTIYYLTSNWLPYFMDKCDGTLCK